ncbi:zinc ribbon domain-containing protein [Haloprofundus sp. MHR1]|uniref:zinc ribbon domain-containing protein n=1 Tax=Haloprofundus sp. MHR1 TaxID=2572921 RepID=UPI0010BEE6D4|nr:zinc ribbon domain-containing protein [Haloprofundus sp. MHR1]QCJ47509.1 TM2 domain-containing protein [Haloprofundus sp. MHR1]
MTDTPRRALVAAVLGTVFATVGIAGVAHLYLRRWRRGVGWFLFVGGSAVALVFALNPSTLSMSAVLAEPVAALASASVEPAAVYPPLLVLLGLSVYDACRIAVKPAASSDADVACPVCGYPLDTELEFCHWCSSAIVWSEPGAESER